MKLTDDYPFGAVDHERSTVGHQRNFADIHFVTDFFYKFLCFPVLFENEQGHVHFEGSGVGHSAFFAFAQGILRNAEFVSVKLKRVIALYITYGKKT